MPAKKIPIPPPPQDAPPVGNDADGAEPPDALSYRVISPLNHNGNLYQVNDLVELSIEQFGALSAAGVVTDQPALS